MKDIRLRDLPTFIRTTDPNDIMIKYDLANVKNAPRAKAVILNTFESLEPDVLQVIRSKFSLRVISIGLLHILCRRIPDGPYKSIGSNLWKEDPTCLHWLDPKQPRSILYVNFGSIAVMTAHQMREFAWGLANSGHHFLWVIRPDLVNGESAILPDGFLEETRGRCMLASWCSQERVLAHPSIGGFLTHCGWNSTVESLSGGVPMICWPFFSEQPTNCRFACKEWGVGMEIGDNVKREKVEMMVREVIEGEKGKEMRKRAMEWKESATRATEEGGSSYINVENLIEELFQYNCR